ncbi:MAG TPA: TetR/AcrR family transcriptional regulator [Gemmatimonadaceae bacterium]|jgi:AcrR family transcriptional regulator|nr:TetR/AcrR family transcriptional regulator [Gemmatimonadaceae bacterium]
MGVKERRQRERTQVREKILDAALEVFAKDGAQGVTMRALAEAIEYSPPVIYAHFRDKEAIIQELCYRQLRSLAQQFANFGALDPVERLRRIGYVYSDFAVDHPSHFRFLFLTPHAFIADGEEVAKDDPERNAYAFLKQTVKDGLAAGVFRPEYKDAEEVAQICWGSAHGFMALHNIKGPNSWVEWRDARKTAHRLIDATLAGLVKAEANARTNGAPARKSRAR